MRDVVRNLKKILVLKESSNKKSRRSLGEFTSVQVTEVTLSLVVFIVVHASLLTIVSVGI